jgi:hypothetical protein
LADALLAINVDEAAIVRAAVQNGFFLLAGSIHERPVCALRIGPAKRISRPPARTTCSPEGRILEETPPRLGVAEGVPFAEQAASAPATTAVNNRAKREGMGIRPQFRD